MSSIQIRVAESKSDMKKFIRFAWEIYKTYPNWVPPLIFDIAKKLDKQKNPFFEHAEAQYFLAYQGDSIVGRIAAIKNDLHNKVHNDTVGFFGFFECIENQEVANALLDAAKEWLKAKGCTVMRGPANPSSNDDWGLLIDKFDDPPRIMMPYNPEYYQPLLEKYGLQKSQDLFAYMVMYDWVHSSDKLRRGVEIVKERSNIQIRSLDMKRFREELELFKFIYNSCWEPNWGFVPLTDNEIEDMAKSLKPLIEPELVIFGYVKDEIVGASLTIRDYNFAFKKMNGHLFPFGIFHLLGKKKINWIRMVTLGILPQHQRKGYDAVLYWEIMKRGNKAGAVYGEASWILEDNEMMNRAAAMMNARKYKTYRVYDKAL